MMTSSSSIIVAGKDEIPRLFRYSLAASSVATSWCSYRTRLDARNSSSVRQLNQPGWVYTCTFMGFSVTPRCAPGSASGRPLGPRTPPGRYQHVALGTHAGAYLGHRADRTAQAAPGDRNAHRPTASRTAPELSPWGQTS